MTTAAVFAAHLFPFSLSLVLLVPGMVLYHSAMSSLAFSVNKLYIAFSNILVAAVCPDLKEICLGMSVRQSELRFLKNHVRTFFSVI